MASHAWFARAMVCTWSVAAASVPWMTTRKATSYRVDEEKDRGDIKMSLTIKQVASELSPGRYGDGGGLYLQVGPSGTKSWLFRYEQAGRDRYMGLGSINTFNLAEARERARKA